MRNVFLLALCAATALAAGCAGSQPQTAAPGVVPQGRAPSSGFRPNQRTWMDGGVAKQTLLYVSNGNSEVTVYRYWLHTLVGVLTDFTAPMGECADKSQNVYITDSAAKKILEYAHGGTKPIKKFDDSPDSPYTCSVDPRTGNLAVANDDGTSNEGNIAIWTAANGKRLTFTDSTLYNFKGCAYDNKGNLFVTNGGPSSAGSLFAWLPEGGTKLINVIVPGPKPSWKWSYVAGIQWDGKYFAIDDYAIYRISLIHGQAYFVGTTTLSGSIGPFWIYNGNPKEQGTQIVGGSYGGSGGVVSYFYYPAGGAPIAKISHGVDRPFAVTVSLKNI